MPICAGRPNGTQRIPVSHLLRLIWVRELDGLPHQRRHVAVTLLSENRRGDDAADDNEESYRFILQKNFPAQPRKRWKHSFPPRRVSGRNRYSRFKSVIGAYHAGVFCIPLPTHARLARDYRPHVDRATPGDPPCRSATPSPEVVRSIC